MGRFMKPKLLLSLRSLIWVQHMLAILKVIVVFFPARMKVMVKCGKIKLMKYDTDYSQIGFISLGTIQNMNSFLNL